MDITKVGGEDMSGDVVFLVHGVMGHQWNEVVFPVESNRYRMSMLSFRVWHRLLFRQHK